MIKFHLIILVICSIIGFTGHYLQFGVARLTPWIPAATGFFIFILHSWLRNLRCFLKYLPLFFIVVFGIITTMMCIKFLPQEFQPLRKKIIFSLMSISSWATILYSVRILLKANSEQAKRQVAEHRIYGNEKR